MKYRKHSRKIRGVPAGMRHRMTPVPIKGRGRGRQKSARKAYK